VTATRSVTSDDIRVIICIMFDRRAAPAEIGDFKDTVLKCPSVLHAVEVSGTFDFIVEATIPDMEAYTAQLELCSQTVARLIARYEVSFVCKRFVRADETRRAIWVPCDEGMVRIDCANIDKVTAEGDYMRIHSAGRSWMVHSTMGALSDCLDDSFVRLHRSILVRRDFIKSMTHDQSHWMAQLNDGTRERVAKVHVSGLLESLRVTPSKPKATSSITQAARRLSAVR
jgi:DNA-binding Lrp family transcriptional regulator